MSKNEKSIKRSCVEVFPKQHADWGRSADCGQQQEDKYGFAVQRGWSRAADTQADDPIKGFKPFTAIVGEVPRSERYEREAQGDM